MQFPTLGDHSRVHDFHIRIDAKHGGFESVTYSSGEEELRFRVLQILLYKFQKLFRIERDKILGKTMSIPPEVAWIVPIILPFIIGLLVGAVIKKTLKLMVLVVALVIVLIATGILSVTFSNLFSEILKALPELYGLGHSWLNILPYSSVAFLIGVALGLWFTK
jgi:uncharacterized membrane protein (Fun14 family)